MKRSASRAVSTCRVPSRHQRWSRYSSISAGICGLGLMCGRPRMVARSWCPPRQVFSRRVGCVEDPCARSRRRAGLSQTDADFPPDDASGPRRLRDEPIVSIEGVADGSSHQKNDRGCRGAERHPQRAPRSTAGVPVKKEVPGGNERDDRQDGNEAVHFGSAHILSCAPYCLNAVTGSTRMARRAGTMQAMSAVERSRTTTAPSVAGSAGLIS